MIHGTKISPAPAYAWTHNFPVVLDPESTNEFGYLSNLSGIWTATPDEVVGQCSSTNSRSGFEWIEVWVLLHRVKEIRHDNNTHWRCNDTSAPEVSQEQAGAILQIYPWAAPITQASATMHQVAPKTIDKRIVEPDREAVAVLDQDKESKLFAG